MPPWRGNQSDMLYERGYPMPGVRLRLSGPQPGEVHLVADTGGDDGGAITNAARRTARRMAWIRSVLRRIGLRSNPVRRKIRAVFPAACLRELMTGDRRPAGLASASPGHRVIRAAGSGCLGVAGRPDLGAARKPRRSRVDA
jgi:hypothetical protein